MLRVLQKWLKFTWYSIKCTLTLNYMPLKMGLQFKSEKKNITVDSSDAEQRNAKEDIPDGRVEVSIVW